MKPSQIKAILFERRLSVSQMAREIHNDYDPSVEFDSLRVMLGDTLFGRRYFPRIARFIERHYGIRVERPVHLSPTRHFKKAA